MTYIKLEDIKKIVNDNQWSYSINILSEINSLPSINPESMIEEMIDERVQSTRVLEKWHEDILHNADMRYEINLLKSILQKFKS